MSASIDQRSKGQPSQVPNGQTSNKETVKDGEFEAYFENQHQQGSYPAAPPPMANASDPYMPGSYYNPMTFPYLNQGLDSNAWSNGGDSMAFLSGGNYGQMGSDYMSAGNGMFPGFDYNPNPGFAWGFPEYSAWGNATSQGRKSDTRGYDEYYAHPDNMGTSDSYNMNMNGDLEGDNSVKNVEQGLQGMSIGSEVQPALEDSTPVSTGIENSMTAATNEGTSPGSTSASSSAASTSAPVSAAPKKMTWASIASQPAKPQPALKHSIPRAPVAPGKQNMEIGNWDTNKSGKPAQSGQQRAWTAAPWNGRSTVQQGYVSGPGSGTSGQSSSNTGNAGLTSISAPQSAVPSHPVLDRLRSANQYNPKSFEVNPKNVRFFIIKSYSEDDIHRSIKYSIWCSTETGNKRLDKAFQDQESRGPIYLLYSVNGSGHFCGMAQMMSRVDYDTSTGVWAQDKWKGKFEVKWIYVKDVPNSQLRGIRLENNENKPVTNSRDTQEVMPEKGRQVLRIIHQYRHTTSIFDDFGHYEKRQEEDKKGPQRRN